MDAELLSRTVELRTDRRGWTGRGRRPIATALAGALLVLALIGFAGVGIAGSNDQSIGNGQQEDAGALQDEQDQSGQDQGGQDQGGDQSGQDQSQAAGDQGTDASQADASGRGSLGSLLDPGQVVVTGFSGVVVSDSKEGNQSDATKVDQTFVDPDGAVMRIMDVGGVPRGPTKPGGEAAEAFSLTAREIGQVFGIAVDDATDPTTGNPAPNIYLGASSAYGLHITVPGRSGDGWPKRVTTGDPEATWMDGLFGTSKEGDPGTIWKVDGVTGDVSVFASIADNGEPNSGPGLGNLAFDPKRQQLYASDLDSGLIHRFDMAGQDLGTYDHGIEGRSAEGLEAFEDDPSDRADIKSPGFKADDPTTWGYTKPPRRVWGVSVHDDRLFYAVADGPQIWSVGLDDNGDFTEARREIELPGDAEPYEVADITFTKDGWMILAQRPPVTGGYDYVTPVASGPARVLRYRPATEAEAAGGTKWVQVPDEYAVGYRGEHRNTSGGVALGYGYKPEGGLDYDQCEATLWTTGESLLQEETRAIKVERIPGYTTSAIDGLQGSDINLVRPKNTPPNEARFVDYDGKYIDYGNRGYLGDVRIPYSCASEGQQAWTPQYDAPYWQADYDDDSPRVYPEVDLAVEKTAEGTCRAGGLCRFRVDVSNRGGEVFYGPVVIADELSTPYVSLVSAGPAPWACAQVDSHLNCQHAPVYLKPGRSLSFWVTVRTPGKWTYGKLGNCATVSWLGGGNDLEALRAIQMELARRGYYTGSADGLMGPATTSAIQAFQADAGFAVTGKVNRDLVIALFGRGSFRAGDADPGDDKGCASHEVEGAIVASAKLFTMDAPYAAPYMPPIYRPKPLICDPGFYPRKGKCYQSCPPGTYLEGTHCVYDEPEALVCTGGQIPVGGECVCPPRTVEADNGYRIRCIAIEPVRCYGGIVDEGTCQCPGGGARVPVGRRSFLCLPPPVEIVCIDGIAGPGGCACPSNTLLVELRPNRFQCVRPIVEEPLCIYGVARGGRCYCPGESDPVRLGPGVFRCERTPVLSITIRDDDDIVCLGGYEVFGRCSCPEDYHPVRVGYDVFQCKRDPGITIIIGERRSLCLGGYQKWGQCYCNEGRRPVRIDDDVFRCSKVKDDYSPVPIVCQGGVLRNNACQCSSGVKAVRRGAYSFACPKLIDISDKGVRCDGGRVLDGDCTCPQGAKEVKVGRDSYACKGAVNALAANAVQCNGGKSVAGRCLCPANYAARRTGNNSFVCERQASASSNTPVCRGGSLTAGRCVCRGGVLPNRVNAKLLVCPAPGTTGKRSTGASGNGAQIVCIGGKLQGSQCACPQNTALVQRSARRYVCEKLSTLSGQGKIVCSGGTITNNRCVCPAGTQLQRRAATNYACVKQNGGQAGGGNAAQAITCSGGEIVNNRCICPANMKIKRVSAKAFQCVKAGGGQQGGGQQNLVGIVCQGGTARNGKCDCPDGQIPRAAGNNRFVCTAAGGDNAGTAAGGGKAASDTGNAGVDKGSGAKQTITCTGGRVVGGNRCVCPQNWKRVASGANSFRCLAPANTLTGGSGNTSAGGNQGGGGQNGGGQKAGNNKPKLICAGGIINGTACACPGKKRVQTGPNAYRCVADQSAPPKVIKGGAGNQGDGSADKAGGANAGGGAAVQGGGNANSAAKNKNNAGVNKNAGGNAANAGAKNANKAKTNQGGGNAAVQCPNGKVNYKGRCLTRQQIQKLQKN